MKILVFSDSHGSIGDMYDAVELEKPDAVCHLGDHLSDAESLQCAFPQLSLYSVPGNCDYSPASAQSILTEFRGHRTLLTHGHLFGVKNGLHRLSEEARKCGAEIVLYGHTHIPNCEFLNGIWFLNPGTCGSRGDGVTYGVLELDPAKIHCRVVSFDSK